MKIRSGKRKLKPAGLFKLLFLLTVSGCLLTGIWIVYISARDLPVINTAALRPFTPTAVYDANGRLVARLGDKKVIPVSYAQLSPVVKNTFLAAEDIRFYQNRGIDLRSIARSAWHDLITLSPSQGASTITEQLAKDVFLTPDRTIKRKVQEIMLGFELTHRYSKDEILEMYLNKIYLGDGVYGIGAAARAYFNKDVNQLTLPEAALLAGLPQAPSAYSPVSHPAAAKQRRDEILGKMLAYKLITKQQYQQAVAAKIQLNQPPESGKAYPYFIDYVTSRLVRRFGEDTVYRGGLKVYTTLDPMTQQALQAAFADPANFPASVRDAGGILQPEGAAVFLDPRTGAIQAMAGGRQYTPGGLNRAVQSYRQPGSAIKPFVAYGPAIEYDGMTPDSIVNDSPVRFGSYAPQNYDHVYLGPVTLRTALAQSINVCAVRLLARVGIPEAVRFARGVGITSLDPGKEGLSMALGGLYKGVTPLEMAGAYGAVANSGLYIKPHVINEVTGPDGSVLYKSKIDIDQAMQPYTAAALTSMMETGVQEGTSVSAQVYGRPVAGKTGTAEHGRDLWFCGFTPQLAGVVWIGCDQPQNMPGQFGGMHPAGIFRQVITAALAGQTVIHFRSLYPDIYPVPAAPSGNNAPPADNAGTGGGRFPPGSASGPKTAPGNNSPLAANGNMLSSGNGQKGKGVPPGNLLPGNSPEPVKILPSPDKPGKVAPPGSLPAREKFRHQLRREMKKGIHIVFGGER
ncbi:transglycosylase domain-containing protein [Desulfotomaculum copahuensis]|uniref:Penicillin-binding protein 1A n=1 Tax=Desulfotomaculum copahuensis TaxID=1838280 RepID=A0A1B7LGG3_9FIRM|nr:PBP1A family penicillin-binding protein [Desulfotomaculum copahuensis]OAT85197.1 hypothetical protein A6M21_06515 [Desulfotomaculum copahuensis]